MAFCDARINIPSLYNRLLLILAIGPYDNHPQMTGFRPAYEICRPNVKVACDKNPRGKCCDTILDPGTFTSKANQVNPPPISLFLITHDDIIKWKHFPRYWPFLRGIHRLPVNSPHKVQWRGDLMLSLICVWINDWVNNREAGDLRRYRAHYDVIVMFTSILFVISPSLYTYTVKPVYNDHLLGYFSAFWGSSARWPRAT